ncbi:MAG: hypothetical protein WA162_06535 [Thermodesulfobacteriota bacterium]
MTRKLLIVFTAAISLMYFGTTAEAGPSRVLIQEMGSVIGKDEVNIDLDVVSHTFNVVAADDTTLGAGNATLGGTTVSSVNVSLIDNVELRIGRLPGFRSYLTLPGIGEAPNNYGLTAKVAIPSVSGLAAWIGYGSATEEDITKGDSAGDVEGSSIRLGAAFTKGGIGPFILNAAIGYGIDQATTAGADMGDVKTIEASVALLYPIRATLLAGIELNYADISIGDTIPGVGKQEFDITVLSPAIGVRAIAGDFTIDAVVALLSNQIEVDGSPSLGSLDTASSTVVGVPSLRVNYKF